MTGRLTREDIITVHGRALVHGFGGNHPERFFLKGIAFPNAPPTIQDSFSPEPPPNHFQYNATGWIAVLQQLRDLLDDTDTPSSSLLNTIRLYQLEPDVTDYSAFFEAAANLGFYILVPLTATFGDAILNRALDAPHCYSPELYRYGTSVLDMVLKYPHVLAGVIGNEVMNSLETWHAAPCIKAYARDLKQYMRKRIMTQPSLYANRTLPDGSIAPLPLLYAAQDSGVGAALTNVDTVRLTVDYLTCHSSASSMPLQDNDQGDDDGDYSVDIVGVNVESWCSSYDTFESSALFLLWQGLHTNVPVPLVFSEMGCSHFRFNKDSPEIKTAEGTRDWTEVSVVLNDMADTWSGYCAYAYWGNSLFNMMQGGPWNGHDTLPPTQDFWHFQRQSILASKNSSTTHQLLSPNKDSDSQIIPGSLHDLPMQNGGVMDDYYQRLTDMPQIPPSCEQVEEALTKTCQLELYDFQNIPSYSTPKQGSSIPASSMAGTPSALYESFHPLTIPHSLLLNNDQLWGWVVAVGVATAAISLALWFRRRRLRQADRYQPIPDHH